MNHKKALFVMAIGLAVSVTHSTYAGPWEDYKNCKTNAAAAHDKCETDNNKPDSVCDAEEVNAFEVCTQKFVQGKREQYKKCVAAADVKEKRAILAARVKFRATTLNIGQLYAEFVRTNGKLGKMFPAYRSTRDAAIKAAEDAERLDIAKCPQ